MRTYRSAITWTSTSETASERVFLLKAPLRDAEPAKDQAVYTAQSLDRSVIETFAVSSGAHELTGTVRYADDPQGLLDMIDAGARNLNLTYIPELNDPDTAYTCRLVSPRGALQVGPDPDAGQLGEHAVEVRLRKTDQTPFQAAYSGTDVLFAYDAGGDLSQATFTRSSQAGYVSHTGGGGYGTWSTASTNVARTEWLSTNSSAGPRMVPSLLLEGARTNLHTNPVALDNWSVIGTPGLTSGQVDPAGGSAGWLIVDNAVGSAEYIYEQSTLTTGKTLHVSFHVKESSSPSTDAQVVLRHVTAGVNRIIGNWSWSSGIPTATVSAGFGAIVRAPEQLRDGWWRLSYRTTVAQTTGTVETRLMPSPTAATTASLLAYGVMLE